MVQRLAELGRSWELHYGARSAREAAFLEPIAEHARTSGARVELSFADETGDRWLDFEGIVRRAPRGSHFYGCGPTGMLESFRLATAALPEGHARTESFAAAPAASSGGDYVVELARSKRTLVVVDGMSILETMLQNGISHPYSCTQGVCGTCVTRVLEGEPDHHDWVLDDAQKAEGSAMMICCSGSKSPRLVLDI